MKYKVRGCCQPATAARSPAGCGNLLYFSCRAPASQGPSSSSRSCVRLVIVIIGQMTESHVSRALQPAACCLLPAACRLLQHGSARPGRSWLSWFRHPPEITSAFVSFGWQGESRLEPRGANGASYDDYGRLGPNFYFLPKKALFVL